MIAKLQNITQKWEEWHIKFVKCSKSECFNKKWQAFIYTFRKLLVHLRIEFHLFNQ